MEGVVLKRLAAMAGRVNEGISGCEVIVDHINANGIYTKEQQVAVAKLKVSVEKFVLEIQNVVNSGQNVSPELGDKITEYTLLQEKAENLIVEIEFCLSPPQDVGGSHTVVSQCHSNTTSRLPKLELPHFEGDILKWSQFWDLFKSNIDSRTDLNEVDKLSYLLGFLGGEAKKTVGGLLMTNKNYQIAIQQLTEQYGKPDKIIEAHYKAINKVKPAKNEVMDCRRAFLEIEQHLRILESMDENVNQNNLLRMTVMDKYPHEVKYELQKAVETDGYSMEVIRRSLQRIISAKENSMTLDEGSETPNGSLEQFTTETLVAASRPSTSSGSGERRGKRKQKAKQKYTRNSTQLIANRQEGGPQEKRTKLECIYCHGDHYNDECKKFATVDERKPRLKGRCFLCLKRQHLAENCKSPPKRCFHCKVSGKHNVSLCPTKFGTASKFESASTLVSQSSNDTILQTAMAQLVNADNKTVLGRCLFDTGSQKSYITSALASTLKLVPLEQSDLTVFTFGSMRPKHVKTKLVLLKVRISQNNEIELLVYVVPRITGKVPANSNIKRDVAKAHSQLNLAEDAQHDCPADVLIGSDYYYTFLPGGIRQIGDNLFLVKTVLGWIVSGRPDEIPSGELLSFLTYVQGERERGLNRFAVPDPPLNDDNIKDLWELETIGIKDSPKVLDQDNVIDIFNQTTTFEHDRYQVKWPWVEYPSDLPLNYGLALGRLTGLLKRLDQPTIKEYDAVLKDQLAKGVIEEIKEAAVPTSHPVHYLPHHCVVQEARSTKLRIVYDASARTKGKCSLNQYLYKGPQMLEDLVSLLLRFRLNQIGITADIEKAFLQIGLQAEDRDVTRFLWVQDTTLPVQDGNLVHYRFCRVPFGVVSSPFLLAASIGLHLAKQNSPTATKIAESLYVDNLVMSSSSEVEARAIYNEATHCFSELSMNIREWSSNSESFLLAVPTEKRGVKTAPSVLGLTWNTGSDELSLSFKSDLLTTKITTKREALRIIASIFDPCGFVAPLTLPARLMFQELWKEKYKWDDNLPQEKLDEWGKCARLFWAAAKFKIPRAYSTPSAQSSALLSQELHCFTDASDVAYSAVVYLRTSHNNNHSVCFVMSRTRLTPLRQRDQMTTPKLELLGVLIGSRLVAYVQATLALKDAKLFLWTDNQAVLGWLSSDRLLQPFVSRRVAEIRAAPHITFRYVTGENNPADIATRGLRSGDLPDLWVQGPGFLKESPDCWPEPFWQNRPTSSGNDPDSTSGHACATFTTARASDVADAVAHSFPVSDDIPTIKRLQMEHFPREVAGRPTDLTRSLRLFVDDDGLLRCGGRLANADLPYDQKFPILIPKATPLTTAIIRRVHEQNYHVGVPHTLALVRKRYWVPQGRGEVAKVIHKCHRCIKYGGGPFKLPQMPDLPKERVASCPPFTYTGLDYLGPLTVRQDGSTQKRWCCLFTCMAVRAIHLELIQDMTAEEFLNCLRRFVASKGLPVVIVSDNASQFKLTSEVVNAPFCGDNKIQWRFIPELSPWQGGFYERLVGLIKHCLRRTLDKILLTDSQLRTVLKEIESILNTRPLTTVGPEMDLVLTPANFLNPVNTIKLTDPDACLTGKATTTKTNLIESWKRGKSALDEFHKMFRDQYLTSLREKPTVSHNQPRVVVARTPRVGELVQVKEEFLSRAHWKVGHISELVQSRDGKTRTARVIFPSGASLTRSISHLYPLEINEDSDDEQIEDGQKQNEPQAQGTPKSLPKTTTTPPAAKQNNPSRTQRKAADAANAKIKRWTRLLLVRAAKSKSPLDKMF